MKTENKPNFIFIFSLYLGSYTQQAGLSIAKIESGDLFRVLSTHFTNGFIDEILECSRKRQWSTKYLTEVVYAVAPHTDILYMKPETLRSRFKRLKKNKGKKGTPKHEKFMALTFWSRDNDGARNDHDESDDVEPMCVTEDEPAPLYPPNTHVPSQSEPMLSCTTTSTCTLNKNINSINYKINQKKKHLAKLDTKIHQKLDKLSTTGHYTMKNVDKRDVRSQKNRIEHKTLKKDLDTSTKEVGRLNQLVKDLGREKLSIKLKCSREKEKKRATQKLYSRARLNLKAHSKCVPRARYAQKDLLCRKQAKLIQDLQANLEEALAGQLNTLSIKDESGYTIEMRALVNELTSLEVAQSKVGPVIDAVATNLFKTKIVPLPNRSTVQNINDEGHFLAKAYIAEALEGSSGFGIQTDGTSRRREKILDLTVTSNKGDSMCCGFTKVARETGQQIADSTIIHLKEMAFVTGQDEDAFLVGLASKLTYYMSDRASNEKKGHKVLDEWREDVLRNASIDEIPEVHKFYCMAHVLLGFHTNVLAELAVEQRNLQGDVELGRDKLAQFQQWRPDQVAQRVVRTTSDTFGPAGDYLGLRDLWQAHCSHIGIKSKISNYKDNRFNCIFETAAQVLHHLEDFLYILQFRTSNKKLQSVQADLKDPIIVTFIQTLAILFIQIAGPYWHLMDTGDVPYVSLHSVLQPLLTYIEECSIDPNPLYDPDGPACLALYRGSDSACYVNQVIQPIHPEHSILLNNLLKAACKGLAKTIRKQLVDFLPGGIYGEVASEEVIERTSFAHKTNLACEHHFGDLDSSQRRRPNCSFHHHSTIQMLKRNRQQIQNWLAEMPAEKRTDLWQKARKNAKQLREQHRQAEKGEGVKLYEMALKLKEGSKKSQITGDEDELEEIGKLEEKLQGLLPADPHFEIEQWIAVAYQDNWYPGTLIIYSFFHLTFVKPLQ